MVNKDFKVGDNYALKKYIKDFGSNLQINQIVTIVEPEDEYVWFVQNCGALCSIKPKKFNELFSKVNVKIEVIRH